MHTNTPTPSRTVCGHCFCASCCCWLVFIKKGFVSGARCPEDHRPICWGGEEGPIMGVPSTLDHLVPVLPRHCLREGLCQITWSEKSRKTHVTQQWRDVVPNTTQWQKTHHCQPEWGCKEWMLLIGRRHAVQQDVFKKKFTDSGICDEIEKVNPPLRTV